MNLNKNENHEANLFSENSDYSDKQIDNLNNELEAEKDRRKEEMTSLGYYFSHPAKHYILYFYFDGIHFRPCYYRSSVADRIVSCCKKARP